MSRSFSKIQSMQSRGVNKGKTLIAVAVALLFHCAMTARTRAASASARPNIVFILTDDQRWNTLGVTGNPVVKTPNIDRLATQGIWFEQATITSAICTPSRASYFLGQFERRHGINFNSGTSMAPTAWAKGYPMLLRDAGYFTGYIGKNHVPVGPQGYDTGIIERSFDFWFAGHNALGFYPKKRHPVFDRAKADTQIEIIGEGAKNFLTPSDEFIAGAEDFLRRRPADRPFCLTLAFNVPHAAGTSSMELRPTDDALYRTTYRDQLLTQPIPPTYVAKADIRVPKLPPDLHHVQYRQKSYDYVDTEATLRERQIREYETITGVDRLVGAVRAQLAELGLTDNTIILFSSDHGITHGEFGLGGKALNYDTCLRVPLIAFDPRTASRLKTHRSAALVQSVDIAPTMLDLAGVAVPAAMQGQSFRPALSGETFNGRAAAFAENLWSTYAGNPRCESVRTAEWKYIRYFANDHALFSGSRGDGEGGPVSDELARLYAGWLVASIRGERPVYEELFHLTIDADEAVNLARDPNHAAVLQQFREQCQRLVTEAKGDASAPPATIRVQNARSSAQKKRKAP
jgi:arylsulfatase A-like enzyme